MPQSYLTTKEHLDAGKNSSQMERPAKPYIIIISKFIFTKSLLYQEESGWGLYMIENVLLEYDK